MLQLKDCKVVKIYCEPYSETQFEGTESEYETLGMQVVVETDILEVYTVKNLDYIDLMKVLSLPKDLPSITLEDFIRILKGGTVCFN